MKIDKKDVARLLEGLSSTRWIGFWPVAKSYKILSGVIYTDDPQPASGAIYDDDPQPDGLRGRDAFGDPDLFFSFARLGARGEPSESSILRWVSEHGLLRQENDGQGPWRWPSTEVNQAPITVEKFRAEVLCARQLLALYMDIKEEIFEALQSKIYGTDEKRHLSSYWPHTPPTDLEKYLAKHRDVFTSLRESLVKLYVTAPAYEPEPDRIERWDVAVALGALQEIVKDRLADVRLDFDRNWIGTQTLASDYRIPRSWNCPDLLSAGYLQFYLLITDFEPMRHCENPACGMPFPATRKNKRFCNATCRSNARNFR